MIFSGLVLGLTVVVENRHVEQQALYAVDDYKIVYEFDVVSHHEDHI